VIVPALPGALSAFGILVSDVVKDYSRTVLWRASGRLPVEKLEREFRALREAAEEDLRREEWLGATHFERSVEVRYRGQGYELNVPFSRRLIEDFEAQHKQRYGYGYREREVELVTLRLRASVKSPKGNLKVERGRVSSGTTVEQCPVFFEGEIRSSPVYARGSLASGKWYSGPAVLTEYSATTVVPPGKKFGLDVAGNLVIRG
jgi:N-methylhydantoinase A